LGADERCQTSGGQLIVEDIYEYSAVQMFRADADVAFPEQSHP
jgi:hypothetical protein